MAQSDKPDKSAEASARHSAVDSLAPGAVTSAKQLPVERAQFRALIVANPNHFGTRRAQALTPNAAATAVLAMAQNTTYEEVTCVGFSPQANRLDAVVRLKQGFGYGGGICAAGTPEYVRFYVSHDDGATWTDVGVTSFLAHDVSTGVTGTRRLQFAVSLPYAPARHWCTVPNTLRVRAILSWNDLPTPNTPNEVPVWGNVLDAHVHVDARRFLPWKDVLTLADVKLSPALVQSLDLEQAAAASSPAALSVSDLHALYAQTDVVPHRYALAAIKQAIATPELTTAASFYSPFPTSAQFNTSAVIQAILATQGDTTYEELRCVGLRSQGLDDTLVATIRINRSSGYSGGPCTAGSREYVTFWADFNDNGTFETCLGTASVNVHDVPVPPGGLDYSVSLPVNLNPWRRPCGQGARVVPIRAVLSWNTVADCATPNDLPTWGNRRDVLVLIPPGTTITPDDYSPFLYDISGAAVCAIDQATGLAAGGRPFGGTLCITGSIPGAMLLGGPGQLQYRITAQQGTTVLTLSDPFSVTVEQGTGPGTAISYPVNQTATADGWFDYLEYGTPALGSWRQVSSPNRLLAYWNTTAALTGLWTIRVEARRTIAPATIYSAGVTTCVGGGVRSEVTVRLDQQLPVADLWITGYLDAGGTFHAALPCGDFTKGVTVVGRYDVTDNIGIGSIGFTLEPGSGSVVVIPDGSSTLTHATGEWRVATAALPPCGYVVRLDVYDRTIANCSSAWHAVDTEGFCLRNPA